MNAFTRHWNIFSLIILLLGAGWIWASAAPAGSTTGNRIPAPQEGFLAPDFSLKTASGEVYQLSALRGHPVLINLWASWCPPCRAEMPAIQRIYDEYKQQGFVVLAVNATNQDSTAKALAFAQEYRLTFPILLDEQGEVGQLYRLRSLPTSYFIDSQGIVREVVVGGPMAEALLRIRVEHLLGK